MTTEEQKNLEIMQRMLDLLFAGEYDAALELATEDIEWIVPGPSDDPLAGRYRGVAHVRRLFSKFWELVDDIEEYVVEEILARGQTVVTLGHSRYRFAPCERVVTVHWAYVVTFRDGRVAQYTSFRHDL